MTAPRAISSLARSARDPDGRVVQHAEPLAVIGEGVVKAAGQVGGEALPERDPAGEDGAAGGEPGGADEIGRVRELEEEDLARRSTGLP